MSFTNFICPDGKETSIKDCLQGCRLKGVINPSTDEHYCPANRCLSTTALRAIAEQREWEGIPSTTQLLNGTRETFLRITNEYAISPLDHLFMLYGTKIHGVLEQYVADDELAEVRLNDGVSTGAFDLWTPEDGGTLIDHKTYGSYKAQKVLGLEKEEILTGEYYKNGKPKTRKVYRSGGRKDRLDLAIQMNDYRMKIESQLGKPVSNMVCEIIVRDGNTYMAESRGITQNGYLVKVNKISDYLVKAYMKKKAKDLLVALETNTLPPKCRPRECWHGLKCEKYCPVKQYCL